MRRILKQAAIVALLVALGRASALADKDETAARSNGAQIERGKYVTIITGCNDCHTPGYAAAGGNAPLDSWLIGDKLGFRGPWGTTYAVNLRLYMQNLSEDEWVKTAKGLRTRPPMPWFSVNAIAEDDLRAMFKFVRSLGPAGEPAPEGLPAGETPNTPTVDWPSSPD